MERSFEIDVPAPFRLDLTVWALRRRGHNQVDGYDDGRWRRVMVTAGRTVETIVTQQAGCAEPRLLVEMTFRGSPRGGALEEVPSRRKIRRVVDRCLGLEVNLDGFYRRTGRDRRLAGLAGRFYGMRPPASPPCSKRW